MCGRYTLRRDPESIRREPRVESSGGSVIFEPRYNIAPTQQVPILTIEESGVRQLTPPVREIATPPRHGKSRPMRNINARAESQAWRPRWREMLQRTRCAVIADGFYECSGPARSASRRPFWFHRPDDGLLLIAGLWQWRDIGEGYLQEFTIITTAANSMVSPIHDPMPVILEGDALALWLNPNTMAKDLPGLLAPAPDDLLGLRKVSPLVNSIKE